MKVCSENKGISWYQERIVDASSANLGLVILFFLTCITSLYAFGQNGFALSAPVIYSKVEAPNNWSPPTAVNRLNQFNGTSIGYGINLNYSFRPTFITKNQHFFLNIGAGYYNQRFDLERPFDYVSPLLPIFYTDLYSYYCWQLSAGLTYNYPLSKNYFLSGNLSYNKLNSFRQEYTPTSNHGYGELTQVNHNRIDFGNTLVLAIGLNRNLGNGFLLGLNVLVPLYIRWRNDKIFKDDPTEFSHPKFSLGSSISITYRLKNI
ncbi:MAG TPA: hypothetical protein PK185_04675 [Cyclobacteriaceae bacterium]|nr:hypothetical protein [Cyclobacteriaceae bacterium]HRK53186.1 hypothetical protein [Cyclobacteriaceae bacterium]